MKRTSASCVHTKADEVYNSRGPNVQKWLIHVIETAMSHFIMECLVVSLSRCRVSHLLEQNKITMVERQLGADNPPTPIQRRDAGEGELAAIDRCDVGGLERKRYIECKRRERWRVAVGHTRVDRCAYGRPEIQESHLCLRKARVM